MAGIERIMQGAVGAALTRAAEATGVDFGQLLATARRESSFDPRARAATSSAAGMFQFIESTWLEMVRRHGAKHGVGDAAAAIEMVGGRPRVTDAALRRQILDLRFDPELSARMAGELTRENAAALESRFGRPATAGELYAAHVLGPAGAARLIEAAAKGAPSAAALFPREAEANRHLFYDRAGTPRTAEALLARFARGFEAGDPPVKPAAPAQAPSVAPLSPLGLLGPTLLGSTFLGPVSLELMEEPEPSLLARLVTDAYARAKDR